MQRPPSLPLAVAAALLTALPVQAQTVEVGPAVGGLLPLGSAYENPAYFRTDLPTNPGDLSGFLVGAHLRLRFGWGGLQVEASQAYSSVGGGATPIGLLSPARVKVQLASVQALHYWTPRTHRTQGWLGLGPGLVRYTGGAYSHLDAPTQVAGVVGSGLSVPLVGSLRAEVTGSLTVYHLRVRDSQGASLESGIQFDSRLGLGLGWLLH
jgi:hypothetical protein